MHDRKASKLKFGAVTFGFEVSAYAHYYRLFCMFKGRQTSRSVSANLKLKLEVSKVPAPVVKLDYGFEWPVSSQIKLTEVGVPILAKFWWQNAFKVPQALQKQSPEN